MKAADLFRKLAALGLTPDQIGSVMDIFDAEAETRKSKARARVQKWRDKNKPETLRNVTETLQSVTKRLTRVEDSSSKKEISGKVKEERTPAASPRQKATRLSHDWVIPEHWLQEAIDAGLSRSQALASAAAMRNWSLSDPKGAKLDWLATWRNWFAREVNRQPRSGAPPPQPRNAGELARMKLSGTHDHEPPHTEARRLDTGNGERQIEGPGIARRFAVSADILGRA